MTTTSTMDTLFVGHARLKYHVAALARAGQRAAAEELEREADRLGEILGQIEGVISDLPEANPDTAAAVWAVRV